ncbi:hypothetical protein SAMN05518672_113150 [Chitinophaga sp. CF118]|uniref:DUF6266 family protein n=1 Tax=Chitinophaga sp. CF118 TaxID=1884367 RepID=UPI0008E19DD0|nr:DUF6266 family protein [Chitinophaga sp. CF118]SFE98337.1 hypothetical protein SAMN05518672_113150 [Chitinophaga sp. CF118]
MGTQLKGPLGPFIGKVGSIIGSIVKGRNIITSLHTKSNRPATEAQLNQRVKFGMVTGFLGYFGDLIEIGFQTHKIPGSAMNAAVAYNLKYAVTGVSPNFSINYPELSFSRGKLIGPKNSAIQALAGANIKFTWLANPAALKLTNPTDQLQILVYNPAKNEFATEVSAALRSDLTYTLQLPHDFSGDKVHCYMAFADIEGRVSDSLYAGSITLL